jgi:hypothetical protein
LFNTNLNFYSPISEKIIRVGFIDPEFDVNYLCNDLFYLFSANNTIHQLYLSKDDALEYNKYPILYSSDTQKVVEISSKSDVIPTSYFQVSNTIPIADFDAVGDIIELTGETDMFYDEATGNVRSAWNFGDLNTLIYQTGSPKFITEISSDKSEYEHVLNTGQLISDTNTNLLNIVDLSKRKEMSENWGKINGIVSKGNLLKVIQERNISSIYLDRLEVQQGDEAQQQTNSDTLGTVNDGVSNYGTKYQSSILRNGNHIYFYDKHNCALVSDASNGTRDIGKIAKFHLGVKQINDKIITAEANDKLVKIISGCDKENSYIYFTFKIPILVSENTWQDEYTTVVYNENTNRIECYASLTQNCYSNIGDVMYSTKVNGTDINILSHNDYVNVNKFNGVEHPQQLSVHFNYPEEVLFMSLIIEGSSVKNDGTGWHCDKIVTYDDGFSLINDSNRALYSRLINKKFINQENKLTADFLKGMKKSIFEGNLTLPKLEKLQNGDDLRGKVLSIYLQNELLEDVTTENIGVEIIKN